jgi:hypothetical protein
LPENPLLPNARLKELYALMQHCRALSPRGKSLAPLEALLAATTLQLEPGDVLASVPQHPMALKLAAERNPTPLPQTLQATAGTALALKLAGAHGLSLAFTATGPSTARTEPGWIEALTYATAAELPVILVCLAPRPSAARRPAPATSRALDWDSLQRLNKRLRLPILSVDATDAVAVYRVMQESVIRARRAAGPAIVWAMLPTPAQSTPQDDPLRKMKRYLAARNLLPSATAKRIR